MIRRAGDHTINYCPMRINGFMTYSNNGREYRNPVVLQCIHEFGRSKSVNIALRNLSTI